ncbi:Protein of unknown function [Mesobacillus persicus]|uniref:DUF4085 domain-containing protein n=1 Tax=Mesobacillus persicus TaxID=930146 RepID=A0A1H8AN95_9BACI|nr:DUF4085 family protein [Mesobacillus persicus]SEM72023.1 Protein of unknown function [Mesobacillus persicus]
MMWNLSKEAKEKFLKCNLLPIHESDEEWEVTLREAQEEGEDLQGRLTAELDEVKDELVQILPSRFLPYLENGQLNQPTLPKAVREDYLQWMRENDKKFEQILDAAYEQTKQAVATLPSTVQEIFAESLHDSTIERLERERDALHLYLNTDGGFSTKALIQFTFKGIVSEEGDHPIEVGNWLVYDELQKTKDGYGFRVLFDSPDNEWTIEMKDLDARYYYRPSLFVRLRDEEKLEETTLMEYAEQLNPDQQYWLITPDVTCVVQSLTDKIILENGKIEFEAEELVVTVGNERFTYGLEECNPIQFIYTDVYEDPYAEANEPVPTDELEQAALSDELEWQVRAWNTMYRNPQELADIINRVLLKIEMTEENEMILNVYTNHFYEEGILTEAVIEKFKAFME